MPELEHRSIDLWTSLSEDIEQGGVSTAGRKRSRSCGGGVRLLGLMSVSEWKSINEQGWKGVANEEG
eukprot:1160744-Pelagomonas_calceolata.AAC.15